MNKKAASYLGFFLVSLVILGLGIFVFAEFVRDSVKELKEDADIEVCRASVVAQAGTRRVPGVGIEAPKTTIPLDCQRRSVKIYEDNVKINGKKSYEFKKLGQEQVNNIVAEELRLCWYKMVEGKATVFEESLLFFFDNPEVNSCLICSEILFDNKLKGRSYSGLLKYLESKNIPRGKISYYQYLVRSQRDTYTRLDIPWIQWTPRGWGTTSKIEDSTINTNEKYTVYFLAFVPTTLRQKIGAYSRAYYIGLNKEEEVLDQCTYLVN